MHVTNTDDTGDRFDRITATMQLTVDHNDLGPELCPGLRDVCGIGLGLGRRCGARSPGV